jgi:hypothetical protein
MFAALGFVCVAGTISAAAIAGIHAAQSERWRGWQKLAGSFIVGFLHIAQPVARAWGRLKGWRALLKEPCRYSADQRLWGNMHQRDLWLQRLERQLRRFGWIARPSCSFGKADLDVLGPAPFKLQIESICEENLEKGFHFLRYRVTKRRTLKTYGYYALCATAMAFSIIFHIWPLLVPLNLFLLVLLSAEFQLTRAISQLAIEAGEGLGMTPVDEVYL